MICPTWKIICDYEVLSLNGETRGKKRKKKKNLISASREQKQIQDFKGNTQPKSQPIHYLSH